MSTAKLPVIATMLGLLTFGFASVAEDPQPPQDFIQFDGERGHYVEVPDDAAFSIPRDGGLTVSAWVRPDTWSFPVTEGCGFLHWLGKGGDNQNEWAFRMYREDATGCPNARPKRISFYVFNIGPPPQRGCGSYFQDPIEAGEWVHVVGIADDGTKTTQIYKNHILRNTNSYAGIITPERGPNPPPLRMGTRDHVSFFQGGLAQVRIWNRVLSEPEIDALYFFNVVPQDGLVAEYLLNEGEGEIVHDTAGGHDGSAIGTSWGSGSFPISNTSMQNGGGC